MGLDSSVVKDSLDLNNGTNQGTVRTDGKVGYALDFVQTDNDYVDLGAMDSYEGKSEVSFETYFKIDYTNGDDILFSKGSTSSTYYPLIWRDESASGSTRTDTLSMAVTGASNRLMLSTNSLGDTNWHYMVLVFDGGAQQLKGYVDGVEDAFSPATSGLTTFPTSTNDLWIGRWQYSTGYNFDGMMDEIRISNSTRSDSWISSSYATLTDSFVTYGQEETLQISSMSNLGSTDISGYLRMNIDSNISGNWVFNETVLDDTISGKLRNITKLFSLAEIWNGLSEGSGWNTLSTESGYYRARVELVDIYGNVLEDGNNGFLNSTYRFYVDITPPTYLGGNISNSLPEPNELVNFQANWSDNGGLSSWEFYWSVDSAPYSLQDSGNFGGLYNTSIASVIIPGAAEGKLVEYYFKAIDSQSAETLSNISNFTVKDITSPVIGGEISTPSKIYINQTVNISATITDNILVDSAWANITWPDNIKEILFLTNTSNKYFELYFNTSKVGKYNITIFSNDSSGNIGQSSEFSFSVYGFSNVSIINSGLNEHQVNTFVELNCLVEDHNTSLVIENYPVSFYAAGQLIGINYTNSLGIAQRNWNVTGIGEVEINCTINNESTLYYEVNYRNDNSSIFVLVSNVSLTALLHENNVSYSLEEYETYDVIDYVTINATNAGRANATNVNLKLNVIDQNNNIVSWFTTQEKTCNELGENESCTPEFNNTEIGYNITDLVSKLYQWNLTINWSNGGIPPNNYKKNFTVHHVPDNISVVLNQSEITPSGATKYLINFTNPWSKNLSGVNITINCPVITGLSCTCINQSGQECNIGEIENLTTAQIGFNITTTVATPIGDYRINITVEYENPGQTYHNWDEIKNLLLQVKPLVAFIVDYPTNITRGDEFNLTGYAINIGPDPLTELTLNWTLPQSWVNITGGLISNKTELVMNEKFWNNITVNSSTYSELGPQSVILRTSSPDANYDDDYKTIYVYDRTNITNITVSNSNPFRGEQIQIYANLQWINSSNISNQILRFQNTYINETNQTGWAKINYTIPTTASLGDNSFEINVSYEGDSIIFALPSFSSLNISVKDRINISIQAEPKIIGYGQKVSLYANITQSIPIDKVIANVSTPLGSDVFSLYNLTEIYSGLFNSTWRKGKYNFTVFANNTGGYANKSDVDYFEISSNASIIVKTDKVYYGANEIVNLSAPDQQISWWDPSYLYRKPINITNNAGDAMEANYSINISLDTTGSKIRDDGNDVRIVYWTGSENIELARFNETGFNTINTQIWFRTYESLGASSSNNNYYVYYGFTSASNPGYTKKDVYEFYDDFTSNSLSNYTDREHFSHGSGTSWTHDAANGYVNTGTDNDAKTLRYTASTLSTMQLYLEMQSHQVGDDDSFGLGWLDSSFVSHGVTLWDNNHGVAGFYNMPASGDAGALTVQDVSFDHNQNPSFKLSVARDQNGAIYGWFNGSANSQNGFDDSAFTPTTIALFTDGMAAPGTTSYDYFLARKFIYPEPTNDVGSEEIPSPSRIEDSGSTNISGFSVLFVERNVSGVWTYVDTVINDTITNTKRNITVAGFLDLENLWNVEGSGFNTLIRTSSQYRVFAGLFDPYGYLLNNDDYSNISGYAYFYIDTEAPEISLNLPLNATWTNVQLTEFRYVPNDSISLENCSLWGNWSIGWHLNNTNTTPLNGQENTFEEFIPEGLHIWAIDCYDNVGNSQFSDIYNLNIDVTNPSINLFTPKNNANKSSGKIGFNFSTSDNFAQIMNCSLNIDGIKTVSEILVNNSNIVEYNYSIYQAGLHNWTVNCSDLAGNSILQNVNNFTVIAGPDSLSINLTEDNSSMVLNWSSSLYANYYEIYISNNYTAGFSLTPNITGIYDLNWTDYSAADSQKRYYKVAAVKGSAVALSQKTLGKQSLEINPTWNLISVPFNISEWKLYDGSLGKDLFTYPGDCLSSIWYFNETNQSYLRSDYISGSWLPAIGSESFTSVEAGRGYWVEATIECNMTMFGEVPTNNKTIELEQYWNIVGQYSGKNQMLYDESVSKVIDITPSDSTSAILRYNTELDKFEVTVHWPGFGWFPSFNNQEFLYLKPMQGYYFDQLQKGNWTHDPEKN